MIAKIQADQGQAAGRDLTNQLEALGVFGCGATGNIIIGQLTITSAAENRSALISEPQAAQLKDLLYGWVIAHNAVNSKALTHQAAWLKLNRRIAVTTYRATPADQFEAQRDWLKQQIKNRAERAPEKTGLLGYFGLTAWWLESFTEAERTHIEANFKPLGMPHKPLTQGMVSATSERAESLLFSVAKWLMRTEDDAALAVKIRTKARQIKTGDEAARDDYWERPLNDAKRLWDNGALEQAREALLALPYKLKNEFAPPEIVSAFDRLFANFTRADPYYRDVMAVAAPKIAELPGIIQSGLAMQFPQFDAKQFRYAMYYGEKIGDIRREKKGRSYGLFLSVGASA